MTQEPDLTDTKFQMEDHFQTDWGDIGEGIEDPSDMIEDISQANGFGDLAD